MTPAQRRYLRIETVIAAAINAVLSIVFLIIVMGGRDPVPVRGWDGIAADAVPQSLMIALMSVIVPTLLTRRRLIRGTIAPLAAGHRWPRNVIARGLMIAVPVAVVAGTAHALLLPLTGSHWSFAAVAVFKPVYGGLLGAAVARVAVQAALSDTVGDAR